MSKMLFISRLRFVLFLSLILLAPLSKYPSIALPLYNFSSFRFGLYQLIALLFMLLCIIPTYKYIPKMWTQNKLAVTGLTVIVIVCILGLLGAIYKERSALLVVSIIFLVGLVACSWWYATNKIPSKYYKLIIKLVLVFGIVFGALGIGQFMVSTFSSDTLGILCKGCVGGVLGFPRINLFAAEPQFFANAMLPFFFIALTLSYYKRNKLNSSALFIVSLSIGLTFSRGAFIAVFIGIIFLLLAIIYKKSISYKKVLLVISIAFTGVLVSFGLLMASASYRYRDTPNISYDTLNTMLGQLSAGYIELPAKHINNKTADSPAVIQTSTTPSNELFVSPGFIEASANERLGAAQLALKAWKHSPKTILTGVGPGNLGPFVISNIDNYAPNNLTVYIFYILVLSEMGLLGLSAFIMLIFSALYMITRYSLKINGELSVVYLAISASLVGFLVQYWFFGTYINAIYIWVYIGIALGIGSLPLKGYNIRVHEK